MRLPGLGADAPTGGARGVPEVPPSASAILACQTCVGAAVFCQCPGRGCAHARALAAFQAFLRHSDPDLARRLAKSNA